MAPEASPAAKIYIDRVGTERVPVILVEAFWKDMDAVRTIAAQTAWNPETTFYPGIRTRAPAECLSAITDLLGPFIAKVYGGTTLQAVHGAFSLVTTRPEDLSLPQRLPHCDNVDPKALAILSYLSGPQHGGTGFFRHLSTGFETINQARQETYKAQLEADIARKGAPPASYIGASNQLYDRIAAYDGLANRLLIYPSNLLHSGIIPPDFESSDDPLEGRLTLNLFATVA